MHWRDLLDRFEPWRTVYERHRLWSADGTWERLLQQVQAAADAAGEIDWDVSVDSTSRPPARGRGTDRCTACPAEVHQAESPWESLVARLVGWCGR